MRVARVGMDRMFRCGIEPIMQVFAAPLRSKLSLRLAGLGGRQLVAGDDRCAVFERNLDDLIDDGSVGAELFQERIEQFSLPVGRYLGNDDEQTA